ncbi:MAG: tripartite tricarboxylate transporter substrate binding protein [Betaproteobacteria bacterium]|nr:tripartite tricarboxylate transporter substrate binding protein [Betaproteobacteria bacterium]
MKILSDYVYLVSALSLAFGFCAAPVQAADYPTKPIRFIIPAAPGGTTDGLGRIFAARMSEVLGQQVVVDNRPSASGVLAAEVTKNSMPDGHTIFLPYHQHTVNAALIKKLPYHPVKDFTPITQLTEAGLLLVVNPSSPAKTPMEFIDWTKSIKALNFGSAGIGSGGHLAGELYNLMAGVKAQHIPYKGTGPALIDLMGGQFHYNFAGLLGALPLAKSGKLRAIAVTTPKRIPGLEDIPAMAESLPGFSVVGWYGVMAPPKLPQAMVTRLYKVLTDILREPETDKKIRAVGGTPIGSSPEEFRKFLLSDMEKWADVVKRSGAKLD